jgi:papilin
MNNLQVGYNDILLIPQGATNILIQERSPSNNYIAIRNLTGHYYLNGNYRIDFPRPMTFAGSLWTYERKPNGFAAPDKITCLGPIVEAVYLVVCYINELKHVTFPQYNFSSFSPFKAFIARSECWGEL